MDQVHVIRHKVLIEGKSRRQVAKEMKVSRNTVKKYLNESEPVFKSKVKKQKWVLKKVTPRINEILQEWKDRTTKKQRITASRLHEQLLTEGYQISESSVRNYLRERRRSSLEVFIPLPHYIADEAQVDFFEVTLQINGVQVKRWMFVMRLMYSGMDFTWLYEHCDQVSFLDGHVRAFEYFEGVPKRCIYDNLKAAVKKILIPGRELTARFKALVSHYLFEPCFARPYTGHDKGGVEARGKGIRLQHLVPIPKGKNLDEISIALLSSIETKSASRKDNKGLSVKEKYQEEKEKLTKLPQRAFEARLTVILSVSRKSLVKYKGSVYSLPCHFKLLDVTAYVGAYDIRFICKDEIVVRKRVQTKEKNIHYLDYLPELSRKPQAVRQVAPELLKELNEPFSDLWKMLERCHGGKEAGRIFSKVLLAVDKHGQESVGNALRKALSIGQGHLLELKNIIRQPTMCEIKVPYSLRQYVVESASAEDFNLLLTSEGEVA